MPEGAPEDAQIVIVYAPSKRVTTGSACAPEMELGGKRGVAQVARNLGLGEGLVTAAILAKLHPRDRHADGCRA